MKRITTSIAVLLCLASNQALAEEPMIGVQYANIGGLASIAAVTYEASTTDTFTWSAKIGNLSYAWENTYNNGSGFENESGSGLYLAGELHKYLDQPLQGMYFGAGYGIAMIDWKYKDQNVNTGTIWSQNSGSATVSESHVVFGSKFELESGIVIDPSIILGSFLSASTSGQDMLGVFFLPSISAYMRF